jgi:putative peptide-modifying radical SAM enzyme
MNFYVTLTTQCNLKCRYCYGKSCEDFGSDFRSLDIDYSIPSSVKYRTDELRSFLAQDSSPRVIFYGGEPLLQMNRLTEIMDAVPKARFVIQTNGLMLDQMGSKYVNRFESIFVSLDGDEALTDYYRGRGVYRRVVDNLRELRQNGFRGEIVARMTVDEPTEIDKQVLALIQEDDRPISSVHWQLDALFWQNDYPHRRFADWAANNYNPRLRRLVGGWVEHMRKTGEVWRLYPFVGIVHSMLHEDASPLRCGAGWCVFNIQTDGNITPCPVMAGMRDFYLGDIRDTCLKELKDRVFVSEPCNSCAYFTTCGGRCLYANATKLWGDKGFGEVCGTVHTLIDTLGEATSHIRQLIDAGRIQLEQFDYPKYKGCEIIP